MNIKRNLTIAVLFLFLAGATVQAAFSDVGSTDTYQSGIEFLASLQIVNGYPDGSYKPQNTLNRAEMMKIIAEGVARYFNWAPGTFDEYAGKKCFEDVPANQWFTKYVCYAKAKGWVVGYENGRFFRPSQTVTFVEGLKITLQGFGIAYTNEAEIWYRPIVRRAAQDNFVPFDIRAFHGGLKRNQMADLVARIIKFKEGKLALYLGSRANIVASYESIEAGQDLTEYETVELSPGESEPEDDVISEFFSIKMIDYSPGFAPADLTVKKGTLVRFRNTGENPHWPASNIHPSHMLYPGSGLNICGSAEPNFDACKELGFDEYLEFTFNEIGAWGYHDHLNPAFGGTITVVE